METTPSTLHSQNDNIIPIFFSPHFLQRSSVLELGGPKNEYVDEIGTLFPNTSLQVIEERDEVSSSEGLKYSLHDEVLESVKMQNLETPRRREVPPKRRCVRTNEPQFECYTNKRDTWSETIEPLEASVRKISCIKPDTQTQTRNRTLPECAHEGECFKLNLENLTISSTSSKRSKTQLDTSSTHDLDTNYLRAQDNSFGATLANVVATKPDDIRNSNLKVTGYKAIDFGPRESSFTCFRTEAIESPNARGSDFANTSLPSSIPDEVPLKHIEPKITIIKTKTKQRRKKRLKKKFNVIDVQSDSDSYDVVTHSEMKQNQGKQGNRSQICLEKVKSLKRHRSKRKMSPATVSKAMSKNIVLRNFTREDYSKTELEERELRTIYPDESQHDSEAQDMTSILSEYAQGIAATRSFLTDFKDVCETKSVTDLYKEIGFKKKASEMLRSSDMSSSGVEDLKGRRKQGGECEETCGRNSRNGQCLDVDYYLLSSDTCSEESCYESGTVPAKNICVDGRKSKHKLCFCLPL